MSQNEREGYYQYMLRRTREENAKDDKEKKHSSINKLQQLMIITAEECGELTQRCSKVMRKFDTLDQITHAEKEKLLEEVGDVYCMIDLMTMHDIFDWDEVHARSGKKKEKLKQWSTLIDF